MKTIYFASTYKPIVCGIADYTGYLVREMPLGKCRVLSFEPQGYRVQHASSDDVSDAERGLVWYGIPGHGDYSASSILRGLERFGADSGDSVLWFEHENGIWPGDRKFVSMLRALNLPKIVTFHTLHFQNHETGYGLSRSQYEMLCDLLPNVDAITVFSRGVCRAVIAAFPEYSEKVHLIRHGIHQYPEISGLTRMEAKEKLHDFLLYESDLGQETKETLSRQRILFDPDAVIVGQTGFLCPSKDSELLYVFRDSLQRIVNDRKIIAMRIGSAREESQKEYARQLGNRVNNQDKFLFETWLPPQMLPLAQRAFDINFYWPSQCTQSGVLAHALGAGAVVVGRDLEGVGEMLKEAGQLVDTHFDCLVVKTRRLVLKPEVGRQMEDEALEYASSYSWKNQAKKHLELAEIAALLAERRFGYYPNPCEVAPAQRGLKLSGIRIARQEV
jgi:hypothetical protein